VLADLKDACAQFDIDAIDTAMDELESYQYDEGADLVQWLRSQVDIVEFDQIVQRLDEQ
jgi:hypothetical protein